MTRIAVVVLDSLRRDTFSEYFDWVPGWKFTQAFSTSHWTIPAHASLFTGKYPSELGTHAKSPSLTDPEKSLPAKLEREGYTTRLWTANFQLMYHDGWRSGFDEVVTPLQLKEGDDSNVFGWEQFLAENDEDGLELYLKALVACVRSDAPTISSLSAGVRAKLFKRYSVEDSGASTVRDRIERTSFDTDDFLFINLMEAHTPYDPPEEYNTAGESVTSVVAEGFANSIDDPERIEQGYRDASRYLSDIYRDIFETLSASFDYVITLSDHGELLGEHGMWNHGYGLYPELTSIPLVISGNDVSPGRTERPVSILDVHRTVADLAGIEVESRGYNLFSDENSVPTLTEYHGFLPWHSEQFERHDVSDHVFENHDTLLRGVITENGAYAYETHDDSIVATDSFESKPAELIQSLDDELDHRDVEVEDKEVSDEVAERLRDLGYA